MDFYFSNDSTRDVHQMQEHFNVMNRIVAARLSARMEQSEHDSGKFLPSKGCGCFECNKKRI